MICRRHLIGCGTKGLFIRLKQLGIDGDLLDWISNYLDNRQQRVILKSSMSSFKSTNAGVPQGSVLGPVLFLVYVNDISESLLSLTRLFADDNSLFYSASNIQDIEGIINYDLQVLTSWAKQWLINFPGCLRLGLSWFNWWVSFAPEFQCCCFCGSSCLFYLSFNFN